MGLDKFIVSQVINMAEDSAKVQDALDVMEDKLEAEVLKLIEGSGINPLLLPFDPIKLIRGEGDPLNPTEILNPDLLCLLPPLSEAQQAKSQNLIDNLKSTISSIIDNINSLKDALVTIQQPLITLEVTGKNLKETIQKISTAVKVIKAIPIPVAVGMPAVAIPIKVLTILSDILVQSDKIITAGKGVTTLIPGLVNAVLPIISKTIAGVNMIVGKVEPILTVLSFIQAKITLGDNCPNITQAEINEVQSDISTALQADIAALGDSSNPAINILNETELLNSLQPNSNLPFIYQGFTLILEFDPTNTFSFPRRRIRADRYFASETSTFFTFSPSSPRTELNGPIILYNDPGNLSRYSFASSTQILVQEMKYNIDQYLLGVAEIVNLEEAIDENRNPNTDGGDSSENEPNPPELLPLLYTVNYSYTAFSDSTVTPSFPLSEGTITVFLPSSTDPSEEYISVLMNQIITSDGSDINDTTLVIKRSNPQFLETRWNQKTNSWLTNPQGTNNNSPITLIPGIYNFTLTMNNNEFDSDQIKTNLLIENTTFA